MKRIWPLALSLVAACGGRTRPSAQPEPVPAERPVTVTPPPVRTDTAPRPVPKPAPVERVETPGSLPPIPSVTGQPLAPNVIYPPRDAMITSRDTNFVVGSVGSGDATLTINGHSVDVKPNGAFLAWIPIPPGTNPSYKLIARRGSDSAVFEHPVKTFRSPVPASPPARPEPPDPHPVRWVSIGKASATGNDSERTISVRPVPSGTYKWFAIPGTIVQRTGAVNGFTRVRLDSALEAYVSTSDIVELRDGADRPAPTRVVGNLTVTPDSLWTDITFGLREAPLYLVEQEADKLQLTLYSTRATTDIISYRAGDSLVRAVTWEPLTNDRVRYTIHLRSAPYGYLAFHNGRSFVLRVRKPPVINADRPFAGLTIAVDPGHPPIGSTGPTGLYEGDATLGIGMALKDELERRGATVLMTRTTRDAVDLGIRPILARRANAHAFVSIHLNAVPDGTNPVTAAGTGTYFFQPQSEPLARFVQAGMVRSMGLRDLGVYFDNLAVVRETWMPAVLCEGAFVIVPEQEAGMRDPEGQRAYARGVAAGIEAYFRSKAK